MASTQETINISSEVVRKCSGFSVDIGGCMIKIAYRTKEDYDKAVGVAEGRIATGTVRLVVFSRQELDVAVEFIKDNAYITKTPGEETIVYTTGIGGYQFKSKFEEALDVKICNVAEGDCINHAFLYLVKATPSRDLLHPFYEKAAEKVVKEMRATLGPFIESIKNGQTKLTIPGVDIKGIFE